MKHIWIYSAIALVTIACNKITVDFTYSPTEPKAGESISFTNTSSAGESWQWDFGDKGISTLKNPTKIYKKTGTYVVTLQVDSSKNKTSTHSIIVYDTIPTFVASSDTIYHLTNVTFTANIYNPYSHTLTYLWELPEECQIVSGTTTSKAITVFFSQFAKEEVIKLTIQDGSITYPIERTFSIFEAQGLPILYRQTDLSTWRQRITNNRFEFPTMQMSRIDSALLKKAQDTSLVFNGRSFRASNMQDSIGMPAKHIAIDKMTQKWYITNTTGLYVTNVNGDYPTLIDSEASGTLTVCEEMNLIIWARDNGIFCMPLVKSSRNSFSTSPQQINALNAVEIITFNPQVE